jgi:Uma2 family endonuclease
MRAVLLDVPEHLLAERRARGQDRWDEMWEGVLHMVPPPSDWHQRLGMRLGAALLAASEPLGLVASYETGVYGSAASDTDYRIPDLVVTRPEDRSERGVEGRAELVVELRSPADETFDKLPFYAAGGVQQVLVVEPDALTVELYVLRAGEYRLVQPDAHGTVVADPPGVSFRSADRPDGPHLTVTGAGGEVDLTIPTR